MAPKKKRGKKVPAEENNPADAILQHKTKQIMADNHCPVDMDDLNSDDDESSRDPINNTHNAPNNSSSIEDVCLHCQSHSLQVQVRCDECSAFICSHCHWCHEFQANHEIRVCDRCDAFYCRACDEMDQCDDCGEVVCGTCSTLLSCKFCGGGLCEECATACGRCGIVLCSRDAKFAVDCDTCRLSYCLVCLASGNKDTCVRCGHRPSKRMEQLVHLRLKSIYKAFKSSTTAATNAASNSTSFSTGNNNGSGNNIHGSRYSDGATNHGTHTNGNAKAGSKKYNHARSSNASSSASTLRFRPSDDLTSNPPGIDELTPGALMLAAAASAAAPSSQLAAAAAASVVPNTELAAAAHAAAGLVAHGSTAGKCASSNPMGAPPSTARLNARVSAEVYEAERIKAEKAAAELLAELEEEEQAVKTKKNKKKKKKQRQLAKRAEEQKKKDPAEDEEENEKPEEDDDDDDEEENSYIASFPPTVKKQSPPIAADKEVEHQHQSNHVENNTATTTTTVTSTTTSKVELECEKTESHALEEQTEINPLELECEELVVNQDVEGLESLLLSVKGVPGKAVLRKNVKKALKRIRAANEETREETTSVKRLEEVDGTMGSSDEPHSGTVTPIAQSPRVADLLRIVSHNHNKVSSNSRLPKGHPGTPKSEYILEMVPSIVGWVIGKGGQRIRDLMDESGARIWIDQDSMGPLDPRIVYVSGKSSNAETAVHMIHSLVAKAPTETPNSKQSVTAGAPSCGSPLGIGSDIALTCPLNLDKVPGLPDSTGAGERFAFQLKPREKKNNNDGKAWREMTCDPRFVPLLIGRRGWTIKNIQDSSGARVDIDQNVSPRKITISGSDAAVEIATRMVGDVLNYPHSMLHGATDDIDLFSPGGHLLECISDEVGGILRRHTEGLDRASLERPSSPGEDCRPHSPPSSLIMTGDGKSTISATSSLSSTPEPSISNNKQTVAPLLPPAFDPQHPHSLQSSFGCFTQAIPQDQSTLHEPVGLKMGNVQQSGPSPLSRRYAHNNGHGIAPVGQLGSGPIPPPPLSQVPPSVYEHQQLPIPFSAGHTASHQPNPIHLHSHNGFSTSMPPLATPEIHQHLVHAPLSRAHHQQHQQPHGVWGSQSAGSSGGGFGLEAAVDFLQYSQEGPSLVRSVSLPQTGINEMIGLQPGPSAPVPEGLGTLGLDRRTSALPLIASNSSGKDESNIVDSLFASSSDSRNDAALVPGLRGLSLDAPLISTSVDPWGSGAVAGFDLPPVGTTTPRVSALGPLHSPAVVGSSLFSTTTAPDDRQHSRFSWGESD
ncbi:hypothetical protein ACA910_015171 [Epithemia clementina (nom. ined.)]